MDFDKSVILQEALQIRYFEKRLLEEYKKGSIHGTVHTCIGQEVFPCILSKYSSDYYFSNAGFHLHQQLQHLLLVIFPDVVVLTFKSIYGLTPVSSPPKAVKFILS